MATVSVERTIGAAVVGGVLDATVISRQPRHELNARLDYLKRGGGDR